MLRDFLHKKINKMDIYLYGDPFNKNVKFEDVYDVDSLNISIIPDKDINGKKFSYDIKALDCGHNKLTSIPKELTNLQELYCRDNKLTNIPDIFVKLLILSCQHNQLIVIPKELTNLKELHCEFNKLISIPDTLINLKTLNCSWNRMIMIPDTLINLNLLYCSWNQDLKIPIIKNLEYISCTGCKKFKKAGIYNIRTYRTMRYNYRRIIPFLKATSKKKLRLNNDIIYKLFLVTRITQST
jgi:Leucine-rich repeat (LRR) protein